MFRMIRTTGWCCALGLAFGVSATFGGDTNIRKERLDNGAVVIVRPVADVDQVVVIAAYSTGFVDEPAGMTQAAHLAEHLRCFGGEPGSFEKLNQLGQANAETLPAMTYFDFSGPANQLGEALRVEAARLRMAAPPRELILQEAPRCYAETDAVERNPAGGMVKHAFMVLNQAWQHDRPRGLVRGGLEAMMPEIMQKYIAANFAPSRLTLVIVGGVDTDKAMATAREAVGAIQSNAPPPNTIGWKKVARDATITWDAKPSALCIAYEPPDEAESRVILTLFGNLLFERLAQSPLSKAWGSPLFVSNQSWPVGRLPLFIYAVPPANLAAADARNALQAQIDSAVADLAPRAAPQIRMMLEQISMDRPLTKEVIEQTVKMLPQTGQARSASVGMRMIIGNAALQMVIREFVFAGDVEGVAARIRKMSPDEISAVITHSLSAERRFVTQIKNTN